MSGLNITHSAGKEYDDDDKSFNADFDLDIRAAASKNIAHHLHRLASPQISHSKDAGTSSQTFHLWFSMISSTSAASLLN